MTSQYRCETCKHFKTRRRVPVKQYVDGDVGECQHPILKKNHYGIEWLRFVINRDLGCASHSSQQVEREPIGKGELEYGSILPNGDDWRLRKFDAGMGETEYRIFRNEKFFAQFDNREDADTVMVAMTCSQQSERDKVLDELAEKVKTSWEFLFGILPYNDSVNKLKLLEWLEELRTKGGEQG